MKSFKFFTISILFIMSIIIVLPSCESSNDPSDTGTLVVKVTDDPFPVDFVESATVIVDKIELRKKDDSNGNPFIVVAEGEFEFDLLELRNGITAELPEIEIEAGAYDLVRLYVNSATIVLKGDLGQFTLNVPSGSETGIKLFIEPELLIQGGLTAELLLDFDLSNSFIAQGDMNTPAGIKGFNFTPVIRAVNNQLAGSIYGNISDADGNALYGVLVTVTLEPDGPNATAVSDENGYYKIIGLREGSYTVSASLEGYIDEQVIGVAVVADQEIEQNFNLDSE